MRNLRPLATPAGTGNGIGSAGRRRGQRRDLLDQQIGELLQPQPGRQRQPGDRGVARQLPAAERGVGGPVRRQARAAPAGTAR